MDARHFFLFLLIYVEIKNSPFWADFSFVTRGNETKNIVTHRMVFIIVWCIFEICENVKSHQTPLRAANVSKDKWRTFNTHTQKKKHSIWNTQTHKMCVEMWFQCCVQCNASPLIWNAVESFSFFLLAHIQSYPRFVFFRLHRNKYRRIIHYYLKWNRFQNGDFEMVLSSKLSVAMFAAKLLFHVNCEYAIILCTNNGENGANGQKWHSFSVVFESIQHE